MGMTVAIKKAAKKQLDACCSKDNLKTKFPITKWLPEYRYRKLVSAWKILNLELELGFYFYAVFDFEHLLDFDWNFHGAEVFHI